MAYLGFRLGKTIPFLLYFSFVGFHHVTAAFNCAFSFQHSHMFKRKHSHVEEKTEAERLGASCLSWSVSRTESVQMDSFTHACRQCTVLPQA